MPWQGDQVCLCALRKCGRQPWECGSGISASAQDRQDHHHRRTHDSVLDLSRTRCALRNSLPGGNARGEVFVPKIPSMKVIDLARAVAPEAEYRDHRDSPREKLHEVLISEDEARTVIELDDMYVVQPAAASVWS